VTLCVSLTLVSALLGMALGYRDTGENLCDLKDRIKELGEKSTQVLIFLSFAIAAVVLLGYGSDFPSNHEVSNRIVQSGTLKLWVLAIFPVVAGVLPLKEFKRDNRRWYRIVRWFKFALLWVAIGYIIVGAARFLRSI
jgi:hypothetical protein